MVPPDRIISEPVHPVICFPDDPSPVFQEGYRLLKPSGTLVLGFIERDGAIARKYQNKDVNGRFIRYATYYLVDDVTAFFRDAGFSEVSIAQRARGFAVIVGKKP